MTTRLRLAKRCLIACCFVAALPLFAQTVPPKPELLPRQLETELALSAAPAHLRDQASVYVLERDGYRKAVKGTNGMNCIVRRTGVTPSFFHNIIAPMCFDVEGSRTLLPAILYQTELLEQGQSFEAVLEAVEKGFASGRFTKPRGGINYMLSAANLLPNRRQPGKVFPYVPHLMFYAPGFEPAHIGQNKNLQLFGSEPFVAPPGKPWSFIIVPLGEKERGAIMAEQADLLERAKTYVTLSE